MRPFKFRLERVLDVRQETEEQAKRAYTDARLKRMEMESQIGDLRRRRAALYVQGVDDVTALALRDQMINALELEERECIILLEQLEIDEGQCLLTWVEARREAEVVSKLKEKAKSEWVIEASREEQRELDEWAVMRRVA
ncbi:MAG TPA: flagellar export protein FliJ [Fimbriimonadaceae bacterium]|nr:flagellar export protein FliJ [Fimbriimonadaceae bacterium]